MSNTFRSVAWEHGCFAVQSLGSMLGPATFVLRDGRQAQPLQIAPWTFEPEASSLPPILRRLRGEWPCVPFGGDAERDLPPGWSASGETVSRDEPFHGRSSNEQWRFLDVPEGSVVLTIDYPESHPIRSLIRRLTPDPNAAAIDFELEVIARHACSLPIALHTTFRMPQEPGALRLEPGPYDHVRTFPGTVEPGASLFPQDLRFARLEAPTRAGGVVDASRLPLDRRVEELLLLVNCGGSVALHDGENGWRVRVTWDPRHFPCLQLWISNRGRQEYPWSGRHLALGVEPVCAAFDLGPAVSNAPNPITAAGAPTAYRSRRTSGSSLATESKSGRLERGEKAAATRLRALRRSKGRLLAPSTSKGVPTLYRGVASAGIRVAVPGRSRRQRRSDSDKRT